MLSTTWPDGWTNGHESIALGNLRLAYGVVIRDLNRTFARGQLAHERRQIVKALRKREEEITRFCVRFDEMHAGIMDQLYDFDRSYVLTGPK